ncbi:MAG TPA: nitrilase-related carbon-nitrogen hydrolase [Chthoniobacterales bacterium]
MKIAVAQISCVLGKVEANLRIIEQFAERAKEGGAELIVFPEMADTGYAMGTIRDHASSWEEGAVPRLRELARKLSLPVICGLSERDHESIYNSQVVISDAGEIMARYRKTHLFRPLPVAEDRCFTAGDRLSDFRLGDFCFGLSICYDLRFPEIYRQLAVAQKVNAFIVSSAWPFPRNEHLRILALARAIENQSYVIVANRVGTDDGVTFCGSSTIIDPSGVALATASSDQEELIQADISTEALAEVRRRNEVLADRRPEIYR